MRRQIIFALLPFVTAVACNRPPRNAAPPGARGTPDFSDALAPLETAIRARIANEKGEFGIAVIDLETGRRIGVNEDLVMHAASTMKVPVLIELYRRAAEGSIDLDGTMMVRTTFRSIADTSHFALHAADDGETDLYSLAGTPVKFRELARRMIVRSSNLATNLLIDTLGAPAVMKTLARIDATGMTVRRGVEDTPAFNAGLNNTTTARGLANALAAIARCDVLTKSLCDETIRILSEQEYNDMIPVGLPAGTRIAHKTGWITGINHDAGIIYPDKSPPFILVVLTRAARDSTAARAVAADVARLTWNALGSNGALRPRWSPALTDILDLYEKQRYTGTFPAAGVTHDELWSTIRPVIDASSNLSDEEIGRSAQGRSIRTIRFGTGRTSVLFWSQMHGDEPTATRALADLLYYIARNPDDARVKRWSSALTLYAIPMLNPDGAEALQRRDAYGVDINRDARNLRTPEGRALKAAQEKYHPAYGFNLHDQNPRTRVGKQDALAAIALLAPPPDANGTMTDSYNRALHLASWIGSRIQPMIPGHLTRYDDTFNPRAFGDVLESLGVGTVLIESGTWHNDPAKNYLRKVNFVALVTALDAIASGDHLKGNYALYTSLPHNGRTINGMLLRGGTVVLPGLEPARVDVAIDENSVGGSDVTEIRDIGDLDEVVARDTVDITGLFIHPDPAMLTKSGGLLRNGDYPMFTIRQTADPKSRIVWVIDGATARRY